MIPIPKTGSLLTFCEVSGSLHLHEHLGPHGRGLSTVCPLALVTSPSLALWACSQRGPTTPDGVRLGCTLVVNLGLTADSWAVCNCFYLLESTTVNTLFASYCACVRVNCLSIPVSASILILIDRDPACNKNVLLAHLLDYVIAPQFSFLFAAVFPFGYLIKFSNPL